MIETPKPKWSITSERCSKWLYNCMQESEREGGVCHRHYRRLVRRSSESANVGVVGMIDGVVGKFADSGGVPAMDCSKHSESGGVCFGPVSSCN